MCLRQAAPYAVLADLVRIVHPAIAGNYVFHKGIDGLRVLLILLVDEDCLLIQAVLDSDPRDFHRVVVLKLVNVANDFAFVRANSCQHEQVLEIAVVTKRRRLDNKFRKVGRQESFDCNGHIVRVGVLGQRGRDDLIDELTAIHIITANDLRTKIRLTMTGEIACSLLKHGQLVVTEALRIRDVGQIWVASLI